MSRTLKDEDLKLNVIINGDPARKALIDLEKDTRDLKETNKSLRLEKSKLDKADKNYRENLKKYNQDIKENNTKIKENEVRMKSLRNQIGITGLSLTELRKKAKELRFAIGRMTPGDPRRKKLEIELAKIEKRMYKVRIVAARTGNAIKRMGDKLSSFTMMAAPFLAVIASIIYSTKEWAKGLIGLDDALANVMKTTGLTRKEARELYADFGQLNTRTARKELILLAEQAGRLGKKSKKDILDFVEVANQIKVALGDDLAGNAEVAIREVGKLTNIYKIGEKYGTDFKQAMLMIGSSINEVSANSQAQAPFLIETLKRLGGIAAQADISAQNVIGYASALDQLGQRQETSATAMSKVIINMFKDVDTYAEIALMSSEDFLHLLETDANEAFLKFLEGLNGNNDGLTVMAQKLDGLGLDGSRAVQVLAALSSHTQLVREQQDLANKSLEEATSLTDEYNVKNNNMAGNFAKIGQAIRAAFIDSKFIGALEGIVSNVSEWFDIKLSDKLEKERIEVNLLVIEMTNANTTAERRNEIYQTLKDISPDIVAGIDAENLSIERLRLNLEKYNEEVIKKIALQDSEEALEKTREKYGKILGKRHSKEMELSKLLLKNKEDAAKWDKEAADQINNILLSDTDILEKENQIYDVIQKKNIGVRFDLQARGIASEILSLREKQKEKQDEINDALEHYMGIYERIMDSSKTKGPIVSPPGGGSSEDDPVSSPPGTSSTNDKFDPTKIGSKEIDYIIDIGKQKQKAYQEARSNIIIDLDASYKEEARLRQIKHNEDLLALGNDEEAKKQLKEKFRQEELIKQVEFLNKVVAETKNIIDSGGVSGLSIEEAMLSDEEKDALLEKIEELKLKLSELNIEIFGEEGEVRPDIMGMTAEDWDGLWEKVGIALQIGNEISNMWSAVNQRITAEENESLRQYEENSNKRKSILNKQLKSGIISEQYYNNSIAQMDADLDKKRKALEIEQAKRARTQAIFNILLNTGMAIMNAANTQPFMPMGLIMMALAAAVGAVQLFSLPKVPSYAEGNYQDVIGAQTGKKYRAKVGDGRTGDYRQPTYIPGFGLVGDEGPELVFSSPDRQKILNTPGLINAINATLGVRQFAQGNASEIIRESTTRIETQPDQLTIDVVNELKEEIRKGIRAYLITDENYIDTHKEVISNHDEMLENVDG